MSTDLAHFKAPTELTISENDERELERLAKRYASSSVIPQALRGKPADVFVALAYGRALGLPDGVAMQNIAPVEGSPYLSSDGLVGLAKEAGHRVHMVKSTPTECTVRGLRAGDSEQWMVTCTWTWDMAVKAGLSTKSNWKGYAHIMLYHRASRDVVKMIAPEILLGLQAHGVRVGDVADGRVIVDDAIDVEEVGDRELDGTHIEATATETKAAPVEGWPADWRARCEAAGVGRAASSALIQWATDGAYKTSVDVPEAERDNCDEALMAFVAGSLLVVDGKVTEAA